MAKEKIYKVSKVEINQSLPETISSDEFDLFAALVLSDKNANITIHQELGIPESFNVKEYIKQRYASNNDTSPVEAIDIDDIELSGTINVANAMVELSTALHNQYPSLNINVNNDNDLLLFKDPLVRDKFTQLLSKSVFHISDFNISISYDFSNSNFEYFNEYAVFGRTRISYFQNCTNLKEITLPSSITTITSSLFIRCSSLRKINLDNIVIFQGNAFFQCSNLENITLSENLTDIGTGAFAYCKKLNIPPLPDTLKTIGENAFYESNISINKIPESVESLGIRAFSRCNNINIIEINGKFTSIPTEAFAQCNGLEGINIKAPITSIEQNAFYNNNIISIRKVTLPNTISSISGYAFYNCEINELDFDMSNLTYIGYNVFNKSGQCVNDALIKTDSNGKKYVDITKFTYIGANNSASSAAIQNECDYLLFKNVEIYEGFFTSNYGTGGGFRFDKCIYKGTLDEYFEFYCRSEYAGASPLHGINSRGQGLYFNDENGNEVLIQGEVTIPRHLTLLPGFLFKGCLSLTSIIAPQIVEAKYYAIYNCTNLVRINSKINNYAYFPKVTIMRALSNSIIRNIICPNLVTASSYTAMTSTSYYDLGDKVTTIDANFNIQTSTTIIIRNTNVPSLSDALSVIPKRIYVPESSLSAYQNGTNWWRYASIIKPIGGTEWQTDFASNISKYQGTPGYSLEYANYPECNRNTSLLIHS